MIVITFNKCIMGKQEGHSNEVGFHIIINTDHGYHREDIFDMDGFSKFMDDFKCILNTDEDASYAQIDGRNSRFSITYEGGIIDEDQYRISTISKSDMVGLYKELKFAYNLKLDELYTISIVPEYEKHMGDIKLHSKMDQLLANDIELITGMRKHVDSMHPDIVDENINSLKKDLDEIEETFEKWYLTKESF